jgi:uncharacterized OsmC-like protein
MKVFSQKFGLKGPILGQTRKKPQYFSLSTISSRPRMKSYHLVGEGCGNACKMRTSGNKSHHLATDIPHAVGGGDTAPQPVELLLSALTGCKTATAHFVSRQMRPRIRLSRIDFDISAERDEKGALQLPIGTPFDSYAPSRLQRIWGTATVHLEAGTKSELSQETISLLEREVERRCPIANMVTSSGCALDIRWVAAQPSKRTQ